jgi:hypothetical protein
VSLRVYDDEREAARWTLCSLHLGEGYAGALAVEGSDWRLRCFNWPQKLRNLGRPIRSRPLCSSFDTTDAASLNRYD